MGVMVRQSSMTASDENFFSSEPVRFTRDRFREASQTLPTYHNNGLGLKSGLTLGRLITLATPCLHTTLQETANNLIRLSTRRVYAPGTKWVSRVGLTSPTSAVTARQSL